MIPTRRGPGQRRTARISSHLDPHSGRSSLAGSGRSKTSVVFAASIVVRHPCEPRRPDHQARRARRTDEQARHRRAQGCGPPPGRLRPNSRSPSSWMKRPSRQVARKAARASLPAREGRSRPAQPLPGHGRSGSASGSRSKRSRNASVMSRATAPSNVRRVKAPIRLHRANSSMPRSAQASMSGSRDRHRRPKSRWKAASR